MAGSTVSPGQSVLALLATAAGLAAIVVDRLSADSGLGDAPLGVGLAGAVTVGFAVLLFAWTIPRAKAKRTGNEATTALVTSVVGFFSVASAWTGLPFVLGAGGAMLGVEARRGTREPRQRGLAVAAAIVGLMAIALGCVATAVV